MQSVVVARPILFLFACIFQSVSGEPIAPNVNGAEYASARGSDYWLIMVATTFREGHEAVAHYLHCYHGNHDLGICNSIWPAPSGRMAIFQLAESSNIMLFDSTSESAIQLNSPKGIFLQHVTWGSDEHNAMCQFEDAVGGETEMECFVRK